MKRNTAFTLVELLAVVAIVVLVLGFIVPATTQTLGSFTLTREGQTIADQIILCRQMAMTRNRELELRLVQIPAASGKQGWAVQIWSTSETPEPETRLVRLPDNISLHSQLSPLLNHLNQGNAVFRPISSTSNLTYRALRFRPNGKPAEALDEGNYLTLCLRHEEETTRPTNFFTIQINPITGTIKTWQP